MKKYAIGLDFGTDSARALLVDIESGNEISSHVHYYDRWQSGLYCDASKNQFRQHPLDYLTALEISVKEALKKASSVAPEDVVGISADTTGSTLVPVNENGIPLALTSGFEENPNAMFMLWKDHTAIEEAEEINSFAKNWGGEDFTKYEGGVYSSEWFWAKILHVLRVDEKIRKAAFSWVEHCDWIPAVLTGANDPLRIKRSRCAAGHKAMWHKSWGGLPPEEFLSGIDPLLAGLRGRLYSDTFTSDVKAGTLCGEWAERLGLSENVAIGVGAFDCHMGAVGGQIEPYALCKVMGTSTCDMLVAPNEDIGDKLVKGICGQVDGSIIPGMLGMEAGQSAFGDIYAWFRRLLEWPLIMATGEEAGRISGKIIRELEREAEKTGVEDSGITALDWFNGRRTPDANQALKAAVCGLNLGSSAPMFYRALVESSVFGAKKIIDRFVDEGIPVKSVIAMGGVAKKSPFIMQMCADVFDKSIRVAKSDQTCALGAAMFASVAAGACGSIQEAMANMGGGFDETYEPIPENTEKYLERYRKYSRLAELIEKEMTE